MLAPCSFGEVTDKPKLSPLFSNTPDKSGARNPITPSEVDDEDLRSSHKVLTLTDEQIEQFTSLRQTMLKYSKWVLIATLVTLVSMAGQVIVKGNNPVCHPGSF